MYGKVIAVSGGAYFLSFEHHVLPEAIGLGALVMSGLIVAADIAADRPADRFDAFVRRTERRLEQSIRRGEQRNEQRLRRMAEREELERIAAEELKLTHGIRLPEELSDEDREWVLEQAAIAVRDYDGTELPR